MWPMNKPTVIVCLQCGSTLRNETGCKVDSPRAFELRDNVRRHLDHDHPAQASKLDVKLVRCLVQCDEPVAWGLRADDLYNYIFAGGDDPAEIAALAARWVDEVDSGCMPARTLPPQLRAKLRGRQPPIPQEK